VNISTADLRRVFEVLVQHLEDTDQASAEIPWDFYWDMTSEDRYNPYSKPKDLDLGQLSDDWEDLLRISGGEMPPVGYALTRLSSILRSIGEMSRR
jgi:hypothetical protein